MYETLADNDDFLIKLQWYEGAPFVHCVVYKWSLSVSKALYCTWANILSDLANRGVHMIFSIIPPDNKMIYKFQKMFGMQEHSRYEDAILFYKLTGEYHGT